jgi:hypothetical protein
MADPDLNLITDHVRTLRERGGTQDDISSYLGQVGVTPEQLLAHVDRPTPAAKAWGAVKDVGSSIAETVTGKHDPKHVDVPGFNYQGIDDLDTISQIERGKLVTYDDKAYSGIIKKALGKRFMQSEFDENKNEIISYLDGKGDVVRTYVNKPGLEYNDIDRAIAGSVPFLATGGIAGAATRGAGALLRAGTQGLTAVGTSIGADVAASQMGSDEGVDLTRAGITGAASALFESLAAPVANAWRSLVTQRRYVKPDGTLTQSGREAAEKMGLDPAAMEPQLQAAVAKDLSRAADPEEVAGKTRTGEFGIATTKGQRSKDSAQLGVEEEMRRGLMGEQAKGMMKTFDEEQKKSIEGAVFDKVGREIAPEAPGREKATLGTSIREGARTAKQNLEVVENRLWSDAGPMFPRDEGLDLMAPRITDELKARNIWPKPATPVQNQFPNTNAMLDILERYKGGTIEEATLPLIGKGNSSIFIDDVRRTLLTYYKGAGRGSVDEKAAGAVYNGFNKWIDDLADNAMLVGEPGAAARLKAARGFSKELFELFEPGGATSPAAKKISTVMNDATSPEEVITALGLGTTNKIATGQYQALRHMKTILTENGEREAWDSVRMAHWAGLVTDKRGNLMSPALIRNNIDSMFANQQSIAGVLYSDAERSMMKRLSVALEDATFKPPNASGTSYELERMRQKFSGNDSMMKTFMQTQSKRELFSKHNVLMSRIYGMIAKKLPINPIGAKESAGGKVAERAIGSEVTPRPAPTLGGVGAVIGAEYDD